VYTLEVMAVDAGTEPMTGRQTVIIHVDDVNDNAPLLTINIFAGPSRGDGGEGGGVGGGGGGGGEEREKEAEVSYICHAHRTLTEYYL